MMSSLTSMSDILLKLKETLTEFVELYFTVNGQAEDGNNNTSTAENRHDVSLETDLYEKHNTAFIRLDLFLNLVLMESECCLSTNM